MKNGFKINKLIASGLIHADVFIKFSSNAHVIIGPSNTGKSYILQCLNYLLGSSTKPKRIKESYFYDECYLEICLADKSENTIRRNLSGGDAFLYECSYDEISNYSKDPEILRVEKKATKSIRTLNSYFLSISGLNNNKIRRNKTGVTDEFSFSFLRHMFLVDEMSIIKEESPIHTGQYGEETKEKSILRVLLTGKDDTGIASKPKQRVIDNRKGRMEILNELILDYQKELSELDNSSISSDELEEQIEKLRDSIESRNKVLETLYEKTDAYDTTINLHWSKWKEGESRLLAIKELTSRFELLNQHYNSDLSRLESLQESSAAYNNIDAGLCPICNSEYDVENHDTCSSNNTDKILLASGAEILKIESLQSELEKTRDCLLLEKENLILEIKNNKSKHNLLQTDKSEFISKRIKSTVNELDAFRIKFRDCKQEVRVLNKLKSLRDEKKQYEFEIDPMDGNYNFDELTTSTTSELCNIVEELLNDWGYSEKTSVSFSEESCDLVIDGYDRNLAGKGYRALSYSAFSIGLMHVCLKNNLPHSGVVILDSPLCTLRSRHVRESINKDNNDIISNEIKDAFYTSISKYKGLGQVIILDNDGPSNPQKLNIGYTEFTKNIKIGRYGFFIYEGKP